MARLSGDGPLPEGLRYLPEFVSAAEEGALFAQMAAVPFGEVRMHGVVAKRRTAHDGWNYGYASWQIAPAAAVPGWLWPLRQRAAGLIGAAAESLEEVLLSEYPAAAALAGTATRPCSGRR